MPDPIVFPFEANYLEPITETITFATDILTGMDGTEQRRRLRWHPTGKLEFSLLLTGRKAQRFLALVHGYQGSEWVVPMWHLADKLSVAATSGSSSYAVVEEELAGYIEAAGASQPFALLWKDDETYELTKVDTIQTPYDNVIDLTEALAATWPIGTVSMSAKIGRLDPEMSLSWESRDTLSARIKFSFDAYGPSQYTFPSAGFGLLNPQMNRRGPVEDAFTRRLALLDAITGQRAVDVMDSSPSVARAHVYTATPHIEGLVLRNFLLYQMGRGFGIFIPSWQNELTLAAPAASGATSITIERVGYAEQMFAPNSARRHLRLFSPFGNIDVGVVDAVASGDTETLTLDSGLWTAVDPATWAICFRRWCRLDDDSTSIEWSARDFAEAVLRIREIPNEAATPVAP